MKDGKGEERTSLRVGVMVGVTSSSAVRVAACAVVSVTVMVALDDYSSENDMYMNHTRYIEMWRKKVGWRRT